MLSLLSCSRTYVVAPPQITPDIPKGSFPRVQMNMRSRRKLSNQGSGRMLANVINRISILHSPYTRPHTEIIQSHVTSTSDAKSLLLFPSHSFSLTNPKPHKLPPKPSSQNKHYPPLPKLPKQSEQVFVSSTRADPLLPTTK